MGPDSVFISSVVPLAKRVTIIPDVVYRYRANPASAMSTFTFAKFRHALEWRRRAWHRLDDAGFRAIGDRLLQSYWADAFFGTLAVSASGRELAVFLHEFRSVFDETGVAPVGPASSRLMKALF